MTLLPLKLIIRLVRDLWTIHIRSDQVIYDRKGWFSREIPFIVSLWRGKSVKIYRSVLTVHRTSGPGLRETSPSSPSWIFKFLVSVVTLLVWHSSTKAKPRCLRWLKGRKRGAPVQDAEDVDVLRSPDMNQMVLFWPCLTVRSGETYLVLAVLI